MKHWKTGAMALALLGAAGLVVAVAPAVRGETRAPDVVDEIDQLVQVFSGGSRIGVSVRDVDQEDAKSAKLASPDGVLIEEVREGSPAEEAGLRKEDIVLEFDGERVRSTRQFARLVHETPAERQVPAVVMRDGQRTTIQVQPRAEEGLQAWREFGRHRGGRVWPAPAPPAPPAPPSPPSIEVFPRFERFFDFPSGRLGISVESLSDQLAEYFGTRRGVLVSSVNENSPAAKAGLKAGDVITAVNGAEVTSPSELTRRVQRMDDGDEFTLEIVRDRKSMALKGTVERSERTRRWTTVL